MGKVWCVGFVEVNAGQVKKALENNLTRKVVYNRIDNLGWDVERAVSSPIISKTPTGYTQLDVEEARENGICYRTFVWRIHTKWSVERAKTEPIKGK